MTEAAALGAPPLTASASPGDSLVRTPSGAALGDQRGRVTRLLLLRTLVVTVVLGLSLWVLGRSAPARVLVWLQSAIIAATYLASIVFGVLLRRGLLPSKVARPMLATDVVLTSALVFITGGAQSPYSFLYALTIVAAGALLFRRGAVILTIATLASMIAVSLLAWSHVVELPLSTQIRPWQQSGVDLARTLGINVAAMIGVGALSFIFGDQLQRGAETLATTRRAAAELLSLHQDIVRSLSSGLITTSPDGLVVTANHAAAEILRTSPSLLVGRSIDAVLPGVSTQLADAQGELRRGDLTVPTSDGERTINVTVSPLRDVKDNAIGHVVNFQDLTELRRLEQHARRTERMATVGQLAAGVAHEIRNPMASISGSIELLRQSPQTSEDDRALMTIVHREVQRLNNLIGDLLDYANPRAKQPVDFDLGSLVDETVQVARGDQNFADVELAADVEKPLHVFADPAKLRQVVWNLVRNAADAASGGGKHVRVEARRVSDGATISVADDGPGIPEHLVGRIFDPFVSTKQKGTGLGLATCHAIVAEHGGRIDVETEVGKGTKMVVWLPASR